MKNETKMVTDVATVKFAVRRFDDGTCDCSISTEDAKDSNLTGYAQYLAKGMIEFVNAYRRVFGDVCIKEFKDMDGTLKTDWPNKLGAEKNNETR